MANIKILSNDDMKDMLIEANHSSQLEFLFSAEDKPFYYVYTDHDGEVQLADKLQSHFGDDAPLLLFYGKFMGDSVYKVLFDTVDQKTYFKLMI